MFWNTRDKSRLVGVLSVKLLTEISEGRCANFKSLIFDIYDTQLCRSSSISPTSYGILWSFMMYSWSYSISSVLIRSSDFRRKFSFCIWLSTNYLARRFAIPFFKSTSSLCFVVSSFLSISFYFFNPATSAEFSASKSAINALARYNSEQRVVI